MIIKPFSPGGLITLIYHKLTHQKNGVDEINVTDLSGLLADDQHVLDAEVLAVAEDKTKKGIASGYASLDATTKVPIAQIASGTPDGTKFVRDDRTLAVLTSKVVQVVNTQTGAVASGAVAIPYDNTIPQNTEGYEFTDLATTITPTSATNKLRIDIVLVLSPNVAGQVIAALYQDSTANALKATAEYMGISDMGLLVFTHYMTAGTTLATTFNIRVGNNAGNTITLNGYGDNRMFGGVSGSSVTISEIVV